MRVDARDVAAAVALSATLASIAYAAFAISRLRAFARRPKARSVRRPAITVLKPVRGVEPLLAENLRSFCAQDYPDFEVVFGVLDPADPALPIIRAVAAEHPGRATVVVGNGVAEHRNPKISTLAPMLPHAAHELLVISDSDMRVGPDYLDAVAAAFDDERIGAATCAYRGEPADGGLASRLGAMGIGEQFAPSALVAMSMEPLTYCFGATMAVRRGVLDAIGGLRALGTHLADDHALGNLVSKHGRACRVRAVRRHGHRERTGFARVVLARAALGAHDTRGAPEKLRRRHPDVPGPARADLRAAEPRPRPRRAGRRLRRARPAGNPSRGATRTRHAAAARARADTAARRPRRRRLGGGLARAERPVARPLAANGLATEETRSHAE